MDDPKVVQLQIIQGDAHGLGVLRSFAEFEFHSVAMPAMKEKDIHLNAAVSSPKKSLRWVEDLKGLLKSEPLPGSTDPRMSGQRMKIGKV